MYYITVELKNSYLFVVSLYLTYLFLVFFSLLTIIAQGFYISLISSWQLLLINIKNLTMLVTITILLIHVIGILISLGSSKCKIIIIYVFYEFGAKK